MPTQPPRFSFVKTAPRKAWARPLFHQDERKRGRAGQRDRAQVLAEEPLCRICEAKGLTAASEQVDHVIPLSQGGKDERYNKQGLCKPCHRAKTKRESAAGRRGSPTSP